MAKKKAVPTFVPLQMGFGFEVTDSEGQSPQFLHRQDEVNEALGLIRAARWVATDTEGTGLTDASMPVALGKQDILQGGSNIVRMRTIQARVPTINGRRGPRANFVFDTDKMGPALTAEVAQAVLSRDLYIAHNAGFDLYWTRLAERRQSMPKMVADTMLLTRALRPELVLRRAELVANVSDAHQVASMPPDVQAAWKSLVSGASGGSLADVVLALFGEVVDKAYQKPNNWTGLLGFAHYDYAMSDAVWADKILCNLLGIEDDGDLFMAYMTHRAKNSVVRLIEPQVPELVTMRETGMPASSYVADRYVARKRKELAKKVSELIALEPRLEAHRTELSDPDAGLNDALKATLAIAFQERGVQLRKTASKGDAQVGEKDLRACRAAQLESSKPLFEAWVAVCRSKKASGMAQEVAGFIKRGPDGRLRALLSHGPVTGRLSAAEPNCQQWPRDQLFRAICISDVEDGCTDTMVVVTEANMQFLSDVLESEVHIGETVSCNTAWLAAMFYSTKLLEGMPEAEHAELKKLIDDQFTHVIVASDFGALDVRVGAALCIRSQREMWGVYRGEAVPGYVQPPADVVRVIKDILPGMEAADKVTAMEEKKAEYAAKAARLEKRLDVLKREFDAGNIQRRPYFQQRQEVKDSLLSVKLGWRLAECMWWAARRAETEYSALRDAFVADIDIHTFTGMKLVGRDPMAEFAGLTVKDRKALEKKLKKELGPRRQQGKIANLSLLYGMADAGFQEAAARNYDEHWTMDEAHDIRMLWMNAYPEVELWHLWTECLQAGVVYIPDPTKEAQKASRKGWWRVRTLADREIVAFGLNAALSYQDQSSGADILGNIVHRLVKDHALIYKGAINQVHDEQVFALPKLTAEADLQVIEEVMVGEANKLTMPYGVPCAVSPACGPIWVKD